jgi:streptogramin lyase
MMTGVADASRRNAHRGRAGDEVVISAAMMSALMSRWHRRTGALFGAIVIGIAGAAGPAPARTRPRATFTHFTLPGGASPYSIAADARGRIWFTETGSSDDDVLARVTNRGQMIEIRDPGTSDGSPLYDPAGFALTTPSDGTIRFGLRDNGADARIAELSSSGALSFVDIPQALNGYETDGAPASMAVGGDGNYWMADSEGIYRLTPAGGLTLFTTHPNRWAPQQIITGPGRDLWFTAPLGGAEGYHGILASSHAAPARVLLRDSIGRITPTGQITLFPLPLTESLPQSITAGPRGTIWYTVPGGVGRMSSRGQNALFRTPGIPGRITTGHDGDVWFTDTTKHSIAQMTTHGTITEYKLPGSFGIPAGIAIAGDGSIWFTIAGKEQSPPPYGTEPGTIGRLVLAR